MDRNLYSVKCDVDNGCTLESWEAFVFADCAEVAKFIAIKFFESQGNDISVWDIVCNKVECDSVDIVCTRRIL